MRKKALVRGGIFGSLIAIVFGVIWIFQGLGGLWSNITNSSPTQITMTDYLKDKPKAKWLKLTGCQVDLMEAVYEETSEQNKSVKKLYIPVYPPGGSLPAHILIEDESYVPIMQEFLDNQDDQAKLETVVQKHLEKLDEVRDFEGWVTDPPKDISEKMSAKEMSADCIVLQQHGKEWGVSFFSLFLGLLALFGGLRGITKSRQG